MRDAHPATATPTADSLLSHALMQASQAIVLVDEHERIVCFNPAAEQLWGTPATAVLGCRADELFATDLVGADHGGAGHDEAGRDGADHGKVEAPPRLASGRHEWPITRADGSRGWIAAMVSEFIHAGRPLRGVFACDLTDEVRQRDDLALRSLVASETDNAVVITGSDGRIVYANTGLTRMLGYTPDELLGRLSTEVLSGPHTDPDTVRALRARLAEPGGYRCEVLVYDKHGQPLWVLAAINSLFGADGRLRHAVGVLSDITYTKVNESLQQRVLDAMVRELPLLEVMNLICVEVERIAPGVVISILRVDAEGRMRPLAAPSLPPVCSAAVDGMPIGPCAGSCGTAAWRKEPVLIQDIATDPLWDGHRDGSLPKDLVACWSTPVFASDGRVLGTFAFYYRDRSGPDAFQRRIVEVCTHLCALALEREEARARIHQLAFHDALTGLPNRSLLRAQAELAIAGSARSESPLAVLFLDLDRFKQINDSLGHAAGDRLLREVARRLRESLRASDLICRLAGDEFVILLPDCDAAHAAQTAERLLGALAAPLLLEGVALTMGASIGISVHPGDGGDMDTLLRHADMAMYRAKTSGHRLFRFFSSEMNERAQERLALETALRDAIAAERLRLEYQPQLDLRDGHVHGVEALLRWNEPGLGEIPPDRFIPLAEESGLIHELGEWTLAEACRQLAGWRRRGVPVPSLSLNLSPTHFRDATLPTRIAALLAEYALDGAALTIEITENVLMDVTPETSGALTGVRALGVRLSIDDFGTGYSSLGSLRNLRVDEIKLDREFIRDLADDPAARAVVDGVLRIGASLGLAVIAEGVENEAQLRELVRAGCPIAQGYAIAHPLAPTELESWLHRREVSPVQSPDRVAG